MGAVFGALLMYFVPEWMAGSVLVLLYLGHFLYRWWSDKDFDKRLT